MPLYKHDCMNPRCCRYIGSTNCTDVYLSGTRHFHNEKGVIIRKSDEGHDYSHYEKWSDVQHSGRWPEEWKIIHDWMYAGC